MKSKIMGKRALALILCTAMILNGGISVLADNVSELDAVSSGDAVVRDDAEVSEESVMASEGRTETAANAVSGSDSAEMAEKSGELENLMALLPEGAEVPEKCTEVYTYTGSSFEVMVFAPEGALPEGAELTAEVLEEGSDAYAEAEATISEGHEYDGMVALDIHFELNGEEVEPEAAVYICMNAIGLLPEDAVPETVAVHHIEEKEKKMLGIFPTGTETSVEVVADSTEETGIVAISESNEAAALDMTVTFAVESFSVFATTYSTTQSEDNNQSEIEDLYYLGLRQAWSASKSGNSAVDGKVLANNLVYCLDYADQYDELSAEDQKIPVYVDQSLPSEYGSNGLVLGLDKAKSVEVFAPDKVNTSDTGNSKNGIDLTWDDQKMATECNGAVFSVGQIDDTGTLKTNSSWGCLTETEDLRGEIGVIYKNIGNYNGMPIDLKVTVTDYAINVNDTYRLSCTNLDPDKGALNYSLHNAVIGLYTVDGKPGVQVINIPWVELTYEFYISGTDTKIEVKGNTSYYDIDEYQAVFLDKSCKGIYVTNGEVSGTYVKNGETKAVTLESGAHNRCVLNLGWFKDGSSGVGVYSSYDGGVSSSISSQYTANAFTEVFEGSTLVRTYNFQNSNYPSLDADLQSNGPDGTIFNSGLPVNRNGSLYIKKEVVAASDELIDKDRKFEFKMTVHDIDGNLISGTYGDLVFNNGVASFTLKHNGGIQAVGLPAGATYEIQEISSGYSVRGTKSYYDVDNQTAKEEAFSGGTVIGTIQASVDVANGFVPTVEFVNVDTTPIVTTTKEAYVNDWDERTYDITITASSETIKLIQLTVETTFTQATIKDYIDPRFEVDEESVKAAGGTIGTDENGTYVIWENQTINPEADGVPGWSRTITVKAKPEYIGGNDVTTNGPKSSVIVGTKEFPLDQPTVNVKVDFRISEAEHWIYKGDSIESLFTTELAKGITDIQVPDGWEVDAYTNFQDVTTTVKWYTDKECTKEIAEAHIRKAMLTEDTVYYAKVTVSPKTAGTGTSAGNTDGKIVEPTSLVGTYTVHVVRGELQITKTLEAVFSDDLTFTFNVTKDGSEFRQVTITVPAGSTSASYTPGEGEENVLSNLARGEYAVTEEVPEDFILKSIAVDGETTNCDNKASTTTATFRLGCDTDGNDIIVNGSLREGAYTTDTDGNVDAIIKGTLGAVSYTNIEKGIWQIVKRSYGTGSSTYLGGAQFKLEEQVTVGQTARVYYGKSVDNINGSNDIDDGLLKWYTDASFTEKVTARMPAGTYKLMELKAPEGYSLSNHTWLVTISNGCVTSITLNGTTVNGTMTTNSDNQNVVTYYFDNVPLYELPSTGGHGTYWYTISGLILMLGAALIMHRNKCKEVLEQK